MKVEKLKWKVRHKTDFGNEQDFLETILIDNGVPEDQINSFLRPTKKFIQDPFTMNNMDKAVSLVHEHLEKGSKMFVKVDCDVDGFTSSASLIQFLKDLKPDIEIDYMLNYEKRHGLTYNDLSKHTKDEYGLIIIPDASMSVKDARQIANNFSADILVLDHHLVETEYYDTISSKWVTKVEAENKEQVQEDCYTNYCVAVNCTDGNYKNPQLCGAGVVQKFIEAYVDTYKEEESLKQKYLDLISLGLIADSMDLRSLESRYYAIEGLKEEHYNNEFLNELVERYSEEIKYGRCITNIGWVIAPKINGCIRYGKPEEQVDTFRAMLGDQEIREYQPRRKHKEDPLPPLEYHSLQKTMARICENVKSRQDNEVRKFVKEIQEEIEEKGLDKNSVLFVDGTKILNSGTITGLVANKLASQYFRPVVLMRSKNSTEYGGSMRGYTNSPIVSTKEFLEQAGVVCYGHSNASGIILKKDALTDIIAKCNEMLPLDQLCTIHTVDWEIPANKLKREQVQEVAENYTVFGSTVPEPLFVITNLKINANQIKGYGENNNFIRFIYNGIVFVKKYCSHYDFDNMTMNDKVGFGANEKNLNLNIIGQFVINTWEDKIAPEVKILYYDVEEDKGNKEEFEW